VISKLEQVRSEEKAAMAQAAEAMADSLARGGMIHVFGCGHSAALSMDIFYRAGGLILVQPIFGDRVLLNHRPVTETTEWERKEGYAPQLFEESGARAREVMIVLSTSGRNAAPIDMALAAKQAGLTVIALTSRAYASQFPSRHSSGKRLHEVADIVIDNHVEPGDAAISLPGIDQRVGPTSTALGSAILQALVVEATANLIARGEQPPVYVSANIPGGDEHNREVLARFRDRIRFL
ncbi:MAG: SIS domain-containing protein, partial [Armatimonadota bacterium]|nr:SIS domain-containing protein [Armatimonadota bacterium]